VWVQEGRGEDDVWQAWEVVMRTIRLSLSDIDRWGRDGAGKSLVLPVRVDWPELRLTEDKLLANAVCRVDGREEPFPDNSVFCVEIERK
jgi:hypothetical protein